MSLQRPISYRTPRSLLGALCAFALACGGGTDTTTTTAPEPIDDSTAGATATGPSCADEGAAHSMSEATPLAFGARSGCVAAEPDFYELTAPRHAAGTVFTITAVPEGANLTLKAHDADGELLGEGRMTPESTKMFVVAASGSEVRLEVSTDSPTVTAYSLNAQASPLNDAMEPNSQVTNARPLNLRQYQEALLQRTANDPELEDDFYQVLVGRRGQLSARLEPGSDQLTAEVELLDAEGNQLERSVAANPGGGVSIAARVQPGQYIIKVTNDGPLPMAGLGEPPRFLTEPYELVASME